MLKDNITDIIKDIKQGKMVIILDDESRENEGDLVCAADQVTSEIINFMASKGKGLICLPMNKSLFPIYYTPLDNIFSAMIGEVNLKASMPISSNIL